MQFSSTVSVDLMSTGRPDSSSAGKTGQNGDFASHLASTTQGKTASTRQPGSGDTSKHSSKTTKKPVNSVPEATTPQAETRPIAPNAHDQREATGDLTAGSTINGSAGAATAAIVPVPQASLDGSNLGEQNSASAADQHHSIVSRMLDVITSAAAGTAVAATPSPLAGQSAMPTTPAPIQAVGSIGETQALAPAANLLAGQPNNGGIASTTGPNLTATVTFSPEMAQAMSTAPANPALDEPEAPQSVAQQNPALESNEQVVQNKYGQIITIHQLSDPEGMAAAGVGVKTQAAGTGSQDQEVNSNFIRSHLPNDAPKALTNENNAQQQQTSKDNQPKDANPAEILLEGASLAEQTASQKPLFSMGSENQSLVFAHPGASSPLAASTSSTDALTFRLPSGLAVPDGSVVDQMLSHFNMNKQLESGTVNLKLHPQELGELRMEIKVTQDNIRAHIVAQNPQAQEMIERHLPRLRETLAQQGLQLQHIEVTVAANDSAGGAPYQDNTRQQLNQSMHKHTGQSIFTLDAEEELMESTASVNNLSVLA